MKRGSGESVYSSGEGQEITETEGEFVNIRKKALERLTTEVMQLHDILPQVLTGDILENFQKLDMVEALVEKKEHELEQLRMDCEHLKARLETAQADCMKERKEKLTIQQQLNEAKQQLLQQAEYCTEMGASVCTLLWSVSNNEDAVKSILVSVQFTMQMIKTQNECVKSHNSVVPLHMTVSAYIYIQSKAETFFSLAGQTMESFVRSLGEDTKQQDVDSNESQFVLALAGIVTNVAALVCGREFLVNSNKVLLDTMMQLLGDLKPGCCTKLKVLMMMSLYNISINVKGLKYISENPGFFPLLWWLLNDPDPEVCLHVLRLLQSVILEPEVLAKSAAEIRDTMPLSRILMLSKCRNGDLQVLAQELLEDIKVLECEL